MIIKIITLITLFIDKTLRKKYLNDTDRFPSPAIYPFWHGNEFAMLMNNQNQNIVIMVSLSKDGEMLSALLNSLGYLTVRGSSSKGAQRALIEIIRFGRKGHNLAFAADGPRGPYHKLKSGVIYAAQKTGLPIIGICSASKWRLILKNTWDKERIPLPFSKTIQIWSPPIYIKPEDNIEEKTLLIEENLNRLFDFADNYYWKKDIAQYLSYHPAPKILIVQPSRIGDIIFALPSLVSLKKKYPNSRISWIVDERCAQVLEGNPYIEKLFIWNRKEKSLSYYANLKRQLRSEKFDLSIDFHGLAKSAFLVKLAKAKFKIASSSTNGMRELSWLISKQIKNPNAQAHCVERHLSAVKYLDCDEIYEYPISISDKDLNSVKEKLLNEGANLNNIIAIHPGGGWISRRWPSDRYAKLVKKLRDELNPSIVLIGGPEGGSSEKGLDQEIISESNVSNIINLTGKLTLKEVCAFFTLCRLFIGNEAGPMHIASALKIPAIAILGPTNANRTGPYKGNTLILQKKVHCQPCRNRNCKNPICLQQITVDEVFDTALNILKK
jgi:lipopolysaccharide heptosyltransferase II